jgi:hypothetical protein
MQRGGSGAEEASQDESPSRFLTLRPCHARQLLSGPGTHGAQNSFQFFSIMHTGTAATHCV